MKNVSNTTIAAVAAALATAAVAAVSIFFIFYYPRIQVKRTVNEMARAFESEDVNKLLGYFSKDYKDGANLVRADVEDFLVFYFEDKENVKVSISKLEVITRKGGTNASIWGKITYETREGGKIVEFADSPLTLYFRKEEGKWRVTEVSGAEPLLN